MIKTEFKTFHLDLRMIINDIEKLTCYMLLFLSNVLDNVMIIILLISNNK